MLPLGLIGIVVDHGGEVAHSLSQVINPVIMLQGATVMGDVCELVETIARAQRLAEGRDA